MMSEVNQAFLRAYLKNRTSQVRANEASAAENHESSSHQPAVVAAVRTANPTRPSDAAPGHSPSADPKARQQLRNTTHGDTLRIDPSHIAPRQEAVAPVQPAPAEPAPSMATPIPRGRPGVWTALGVERGMKAMERSKASPADVRNGVEAVSSQASMQRPAVAPTQPVAKPNTPATTMRTEYVPEQYNQVQFVDGLHGHTAPIGRSSQLRTEHTLSEITEPIAFGAGLQNRPSISDNRSSISDHGYGTVESKPREPYPKSDPDLRTNSPPVHRRFDPSHESSTAKHPKPPVLKSVTLAKAPKVERPSAPIANSQPLDPKVTSALPLPVAFTPSWEVDCFFWPEVVKQIERSHKEAFQQIGKHLGSANRDGLRVMAITSGERGVGRSTVAMHMARCAASSGLKVALVDGDVYCPSLIDQLRLDVEHGWQDCLFENVPLHDAAIHSIQDNVTLFPLTSVISPQQLHANLHRMAKLIKRISTAFDIVFIDANRLNLEQRDMVGVSQESIVDAAIVVVDTELSIKEKVDSAVGVLQGMGLSSIGLVENFQS